MCADLLGGCGGQMLREQQDSDKVARPAGGSAHTLQEGAQTALDLGPLGNFLLAR